MKLRVPHLVAFFKLTVVFSLLLNSIVGQVDELVIRIERVDVVRLAGGAEVALFEKVDPAVVVPQHPAPDVELPPTVDQQRFLDVFLENKRVVLEVASR